MDQHRNETDRPANQPMSPIDRVSLTIVSASAYLLRLLPMKSTRTHAYDSHAATLNIDPDETTRPAEPETMPLPVIDPADVPTERIVMKALLSFN